MNNFAGEEHLKLATALFQNLFPAINVHTTSLKSCKVFTDTLLPLIHNSLAQEHIQCVFACLPVCLPVCLAVCLSTPLSVRLPACLPVCLSPPLSAAMLLVQTCAL